MLYRYFAGAFDMFVVASMGTSRLSFLHEYPLLEGFCISITFLLTSSGVPLWYTETYKL
jgi:hypothetical protein